MKTILTLFSIILLASCGKDEITLPAEHSFTVQKSDGSVSIYYNSEMKSNWKIYVGPTLDAVTYPDRADQHYLGIFSGSDDYGCGSMKTSYMWWTQYFRLTNDRGADETLDVNGNKH